jgi:hypothetical protein
MYSNSFERPQRESCVPKVLQQSCLEHSAFDSQLLYIQPLANIVALIHSHCEIASVSLADSHTSKQLRIYIKTMGFKPFRDTYLHDTISQSLSNHILKKNGQGVGVPSVQHPTLNFQLPLSHSPASCRT